MSGAELIDRFRELAVITRMLETEKAAHEQTRAELELTRQACLNLQTDLHQARQGQIQAHTELSRVSEEASRLSRTLDAQLSQERNVIAKLESYKASHSTAELALATARASLFAGIGTLTRLSIETLCRYTSKAEAELVMGQLLYNSGLFEAEWYLLANQDVAASEISPIAHYIQFGCHEGRNILGALRGGPAESH